MQAVSRMTQKAKKLQVKRRNRTFGSLQLASHIGPLNLGLVIAGHQPFVECSPLVINRLEEKGI
jgi:hypothetical protein